MKTKLFRYKSEQMFFLVSLFFFGSLSLVAQTKIFEGKVVDEQNSDPLYGVTVIEKGTQNGTVTGTDGLFRLKLNNPENQILVLKYLGYESKEVEVTVNSDQIPIYKLKPATSQLNEIVITGIRKSQISSINAKKNAGNTKEVLTTNDVGRLPDINVAEAAQRVSGVSIETDRGEGRFISIRGIQPSLVNVSINGGNIASTDAGRATPLNLLPIEAIGSIEVMKTTTPDMEGTAIGGSINVNTISAFDKPKSQFLIASVDGRLTDQELDNFGDTNFQTRAAVTAGKRFGKDEKFGLVVAGNYFKRDFTVSVFDPDRWQIIEGTDPSGNPTEGFLGPNEIEIQAENNERERYGFNTDLEYRPSSNSKYYLRGLYTRTNESQFISENELTFLGEGDIINQTPTSGFFTAASGELDLSRDEDTQNLYNISVGSENRFGNLLMELDATYSRAERKFFEIDGTFENDSDTEPLLAGTYDINDFFFRVDAADREQASDPSIYFLRSLNLRDEDDNTIEEDMYEGSADFTYYLDLSDKIGGYLKSGARFRSRIKDVNRTRLEYDDDTYPDDNTVAPNRYTLEQFNLIPKPIAPGNSQPFIHGDPFAFDRFFRDRSNISNDNLFLQEDDTAEAEFESDVNYQEDVFAYYLMGVFNIENLNVVAGFRIENTSATSSPYIQDDETEEWSQSDFNNTYTNFLPSLNIKYNITDQLLLRAAYTRTLGRPNFDQLAGSSVLDANQEADGTFVGSFEGANPDLKPFISDNLDLSLEYYTKSGGLVSVGGFYKSIDNQIFNQRSTQNNIEFQGIFFNELNFNRFVNLNKAKLYGIEASFDQPFTFLPGFWGGFGITTNISANDSDVEYPGREEEDLPLLRQADLTYNIIPYFQKYGIELRAAITHRSEFLDLVRSLDDGFVEDAITIDPELQIADFDRYVDARSAVDLTAAYTFPSKKVKILAQARNISNEPEIQFQGNENRLDRYDVFGPSYSLGVTLSF